MPSDDVGYIDPRGLVQLHEALADYLGRVRGVDVDWLDRSRSRG
jgi:hypothetical protein